MRGSSINSFGASIQEIGLLWRATLLWYKRRARVREQWMTTDGQ
jgi:hypothetical protein